MITQEAYWSIPFGLLVFIDAILIKVRNYQGKIIPAVASIFGCGLMIVTAIAYFTSYGVPGWSEVPTLFQFIVGDLCLGVAFVSACLKVEKKQVLAMICATLYAVLALVLVWEAVVFGATAVGVVPFVVAVVLAAIAAGIDGMPLYKKASKPSFAWVVFILILFAMVAARFGFYTAF